MISQEACWIITFVLLGRPYVQKLCHALSLPAQVCKSTRLDAYLDCRAEVRRPQGRPALERRAVVPLQAVSVGSEG